MHSSFDSPVSARMTTGVRTVAADAPAEDARRILASADFTSLAVLEGDALVGVISQTDLLAGSATGAVRDHMTCPALSVVSGATLREAAQLMVSRRIHRVYVVDAGRLVGVLSTRDLMAVVAEARVEAPAASWMSTAVIGVEVGVSLGDARERLRNAHVSGIVVVEDGWPVGVLAQSDALTGDDADRVDLHMDPALFCVDATLPLHRAAAQAVRMRARRVIACRHREMVGVISGLDFARVVAEG